MKIYEQVTKEFGLPEYNYIFLIPDIYEELPNGNKRTGFKYIPSNNKIKLRYEDVERVYCMKEITKENITNIQKNKLIKIKNRIMKIIQGGVTEIDFPEISALIFYEEFIKAFNELTNSNEEIKEYSKLNVYKVDNGFFFDVIQYYYSKSYYKSYGINSENNKFKMNFSAYVNNDEPLETYEILFNEEIIEIKNNLTEEIEKFKNQKYVLTRKQALMIILKWKLDELLKEVGA